MRVASISIAIDACVRQQLSVRRLASKQSPPEARRDTRLVHAERRPESPLRRPAAIRRIGVRL
jgi:hypothetical protein